MTTRWEVEKAVCWSELEPSARLIMLALLTKADNDTAVVKREHAPSLTTLAAMTGLSRSTVTDWLNGLEDAGWIKRHRPAKGGRGRTWYTLLIGSPTAKRRARTSPTIGLVRQADRSSSPTTGPLLVRPSDSTSPPIGPATTKTTYQKPSLTAAVVNAPSAPVAETREERSPKDQTPDLPHRLMAERYDLTGQEADRVIAVIMAEHKPKGPAWWRTVAGNDDLDGIVDMASTHVSEAEAEARSIKTARLIRDAEKNGPHCYDHTKQPEYPIPGGKFLHPIHGSPLCAYCRRGAPAFTKGV